LLLGHLSLSLAGRLIEGLAKEKSDQKEANL